MSTEDSWGPLREVPHHVATSILLVAMLVLDFAPIATIFGLMQITEKYLHDKDYSVLGTKLGEIVNHIEVTLFLAFVAVGSLKVFLRLLGLSIPDLIGLVKSKQ